MEKKSKPLETFMNHFTFTFVDKYSCLKCVTRKNIYRQDRQKYYNTYFYNIGEVTMAYLQGCVDEHPRCEDWARLGQCVKNPKFMTHTCR